MKNLKKIVALLLVLVMTFALATTAFAAEPTGKITLSNASAGKDYDLYKIFDASYNATTGNTSYTVKAGALYTAIKALNTTFVVGAKADANGNYSVAVAKDQEDAALAWVKANYATYGTKIGTTKKITTGNTIEWDVPYGYYYVTSSLGSVITITTNAPTASIIDKNITQPEPPKDPKDPTKFTDVKTADKTSVSVGDTIKFTVNFTATNFVTKVDEQSGETTTSQIIKYLIEDVPTSINLNEDIDITVGGVKINQAALKFDSNKKLEIEWVDKDGKAIYESPVPVVITYSAVVTKDAATTNVNNKANISYFTADDPTTPVPVNPDDKGVTVPSYNFDLKKVDAKDTTKTLTGAKFKLYNAATAGSEIKVVKVSAGVYRVAEAGETGVEIEVGTATIKGLAAGTYYLEETLAPEGYNLLTAREAVTVATTGSNTVTVKNATGTALPATGGMGTTLFVVIGSALFMATAIVLVTKKRMYNEGR